MINIGIVDGPYFYDPSYIDTPHGYVQQRKVKWLKHLPRTAFSQGALYEFGAAQSLFTVKNYADEVMAAIAEAGVTASDNVVFCGFGEPTERMDALVEVARRVRSEVGSKLRLDTNGLGNLVNGRDILPELAEVLDAISISLNAPDAEEYGRVTRCRFDPETAYAELLDFIKRSKELIGDVTVSVVGGSISEESEERCRAIADQMQVRFRVR
jgi:TatD family-associated radical SAM protein